MLETQEKSMQNEMAEESMQDSMEKEMPEVVSANLTSDMKSTEKEINPVEAIMGVVKNRMNDLSDEIDEADKVFARAHHNDKYSKATYDAEEVCKLLNAKMNILDEVLCAMEDMKSSLMPMSA